MLEKKNRVGRLDDALESNFLAQSSLEITVGEYHKTYFEVPPPLLPVTVRVCTWYEGSPGDDLIDSGVILGVPGLDDTLSGRF